MAAYNLGNAQLNEAGIQNDNSGTLVAVINADTSNGTVNSTKVEALVHMGASSFSAYPLVVGTDLPAASIHTYAAAADPAYKLSAYPLVPGVDVTNTNKIVAAALAEELTVTTPVTVATYVPTASGIYDIDCSVTIMTAATDLTLQATWTDPSSGSAETYTWYNAQSVAVGTVAQLPLKAIACAADAISVTATAGTANQAYVTTKITERV